MVKYVLVQNTTIQSHKVYIRHQLSPISCVITVLGDFVLTVSILEVKAK